MRLKLFVGMLAFVCGYTDLRAEETVVTRGAHHEVRQLVIGKGDEARTSQFTVLQTGLSYRDEATGEWFPSSDQIELTENGARHIRGPIKVHFPPMYNDPNNPLVITLPDGRTLKLKTVGLAITDRTTGDSALIATVRSANGFLSNDGTAIIYSDMFEGVSASLRVTIAIGKIRHDVVLHERIEVPPGMNAANCDVEVLHEFLEQTQFVPVERAVQRAEGGSQSDLHLDFGDARIGPGTAFLIGNSETPVTDGTKPIRVRKEIYTDPQSNKTFLIEGIPLSEAASHMDSLPMPQASLNQGLPTAEGSRQIASKGRRIPPALLEAGSAAAGSSGIRQIAAITRLDKPEPHGFTIDFTVLGSTSSLRLAGNESYKVTGDVVISGNLTIEGGAVVKFVSGGLGVISVYGSVTCETDLWAPATFTAVDDHSVGEVMSTNTVSGYYGVVYLDIETGAAATLSHLRFRYGNCGPYSYNGSMDLIDVQAVKCYWGIFTDANGTAANIRNYLSYDTQFPIGYGRNSTVAGEHLTIRYANQIVDRQSFTGCTLTMVNSLLSNITNTTSNITITSNQVATVEPWVFATVLAGASYLDSSAYRDIGSTSLSTNIIALLKRTTTEKPVHLTTGFGVNTTLLPQVALDRETAPDLGYHYAPADYVVTSLSVPTGITVTLGQGVRVLGYGPSFFSLAGTGRVVTKGAPGMMNVAAIYTAVQEQPTRWLTNHCRFIDGYELTATFTEFSHGGHLVGNATLFGGSNFSGDSVVNNCIFRGFTIAASNSSSSGSPSLYFNNNFLLRSALSLSQAASVGILEATVRNNSMMRSTFTITHHSSAQGIIHIYDNFFDNTTPSKTESGGSTLTTLGNNGYTDASASLGGSGNQLSITTSHQTGTFGKYYAPTTGSHFNLVNAGTGTAHTRGTLQGMFGLYHYTTATSNTKEGVTTVDIGGHYIAADSNGKANDTDGDGIADYVEDADGDNSHDAGETSYTASNTVGPGAVGLILFTPVR